MIELANNIKLIRGLKNYDQAYMAKALGLKVAAYSNIETGKTKLTDNVLEKIAKALDVTVDFIRSFNSAQIFHHVSNSQIANNVQNQNLNINEKVLETLITKLNLQDTNSEKLLTELIKKDDLIIKLLSKK